MSNYSILKLNNVQKQILSKAKGKAKEIKSYKKDGELVMVFTINKLK